MDKKGFDKEKVKTVARSRNIKPGFFLNDELAEIDPLGRLLFAGLWTIADKAGRLKDNPRKIKVCVLPYDDCDVDELLNDLSEKKFVCRYSVSGEKYIAILNWKKHQNPHMKEVPSEIPGPEGEYPEQELDEHGADTRQEQVLHRTSPADSLNLIPDSLCIEEFFKTIWNLYPSKKGIGKISNSKKVELYKLGLVEITSCINAYKKHVEAQRKTGFDLKYQNGSTFFNSGYKDYINSDESDKPKRQPLTIIVEDRD